MAGGPRRTGSAGVGEDGEFLHLDIRAFIDIDRGLGTLVSAVHSSAGGVSKGKCGQSPILLGPSLDGDLGGGPVSHAQRIFLSRERDLDRPAGLFGQLGDDDRVLVDIQLAPETASHVHLDHPDLRLGDAERFGQAVADAEDGLG